MTLKARSNTLAQFWLVWKQGGSMRQSFATCAKLRRFVEF